MHRSSFPVEKTFPVLEETAGPPGPGRRWSLSKWLPLLLVISVIAVWVWHYRMWGLEDWRVPLGYSGDSHEMLTRIKAASEGDTWPLAPQVVTRLGAPWGAHWNSYPTPDKLLVLAIGGLSRWVGLGAAANLAMLLAGVTAALAFYAVARRMRAAPEWAFAGALLFAFTYSVFDRGLAHLLLMYTWTIPLGLLCCWLVARRRPIRWTWSDLGVCLAASVALGVSNPYHLFFWGQLLLWAVVARAVQRRCARQLGVGVACLVVAGLCFLAMHAEFWLYTQTGALPLLVRNYGGTEVYALKPVEMFVPPPVHRWDFLAFFGQRYGRWSEWRGEPFLPYLGLVGLVALLWLLSDSILRMLRGRAPGGFALQTGWILAYSSLGGITNVLALFLGFQIFRATNRIAIFISCIALLFLAIRMTRNFRGRPRSASIVLAMMVSVFGVLDQVPRRPDPDERAQLAARVDADAQFGRTLEESLPDGAKVFQLPVMGFPEVTPPHRLADYELFRPYLHTTSLHFSYGAAKFRSRTRWQRDMESLAPRELVAALERYGFAALYLNRKGFSDGGEALLATLASLGYERMLESPRKEQVVVYLNPVEKPEPPLGTTTTFGEGWYPQPVDHAGESVRWSHGPAVLTYFNPFDTPREFILHFRLCSGSSRTAEIRHRKRSLASFRLEELPREIEPIRVVLLPGVNRLDVVSESGPTVHPGSAARLRAIGLIRVSVELAPPMSDATPAAQSHQRDSRP